VRTNRREAREFQLSSQQIVSKRRDARYRSGRSLAWLKVKTRLTSGEDGAVCSARTCAPMRTIPAAAEREFEMRFGPEVALGVDCVHPPTNSLRDPNPSPIF
jgi:ribosomal protein S12 methylthiotransferase accessory factor YcaO